MRPLLEARPSGVGIRQVLHSRVRRSWWSKCRAKIFLRRDAR